MAVNIDWGILQPPNALQMYARGQDDRQRNELLAARERRASDNDIYQRQRDVAADERQARTDARQDERWELERGAAERAEKRKALEQGASIIGAALNLPAAQREAFVRQRFETYGVDPNAYQGVDWTNDEQLRASASEVLTYAQQLDQQNEEADRRDPYKGAPSGFRWNADRTAVEPIPGYVDGVSAVSGARREAVVARPMPSRARSSGGQPKPPAGFIPD